MPGYGKSTLCKKIAYDWASADYLQHFQLTVIVIIRELRDKSVKDALFDDMREYSSTDKDWKLRDRERNILVILDGFDEIVDKSKIIKFIREESFDISRRMTIVVTSRPHAAEEIREDVKKRFSIEGFSPENQEKYIQITFKQHKSKANELCSTLNENDFYREITECPLMLHMLCCLHENGEMVKLESMTDLYIKIFCLITERYVRKTNQEGKFKRGKYFVGENLLFALVRRNDTSKKAKCLCLTNTVCDIIGRLGVVISRYPVYFVIVPVIASGLLSIGLIRIQTNDDFDFLLSADRGKVFESKQFIDKTFPMKSNNFDFLRFSKRPLFPMIYIVNDKEGNILRKEILEEIRTVDKIAKNTIAHVDGNKIVYSDVCQIVDGKCLENTIIDLLNNSENAINEILRLKYPLNIDLVTFAYKIPAVNLGGVTKDDKGYIKQAKAVRLFYVLDESNTNKKKWNEEWTKALYNKLKDYSFEHIKTFPEPFSSTVSQIKRISQQLVSLISVAVVVVAIFSMTTNMTNNWVKSKPWLGVASVVSAGLAVAASFGLLSACGIKNLQCNVGLPFIILATEVDDSFVVLACWKVTDCGDSVEKRMEQTYRNAAVSITITSLTNFFCYCIGMTAQFPGVRIFCLYAATCIFFSYFYQLFFFGGCLALSGYREGKGLHPFTFKPAFGIWGVLSLQEGLNVYKFNSESSEITQGFHVYYKYFTEYSFTVHVVINETLDYSNPRVQQTVHDFMQKFHTIENIAEKEYELCWLKYYKVFQNHPISKYSLRGYDLSQKQDFIDALRNVFLKFTGAKQFKNDIIFNHNYTDIVASRFLFTAKNVSDRVTEFKIANDLSKIAEEAPFSVVIHTLSTLVAEQGIVIRQMTFQMFWITSLLIFVIFVSLIPNLHCALIVAICVVSITLQTIGFMSLWAINLDIISVLILIMCIGFCVNYPTHICYCYITSSQSTTKVSRYLFAGKTATRG
ncbi:patched domain-containing protein 3-like [Centruroides vittatus]|uniref:patched domain-containing protein 3-like n=1 Tax=Centruroides vittatus TaxID=120091 RepID=UPI00350EFC08